MSGNGSSKISDEKLLFDKISAITETFYPVFAGIVTVIQILFTVMLLAKIIKKKPNFTSAYFLFLTIGYIVEAAMFIVYFIHMLSGKKIQTVLQIIIWYHLRFFAFCNTVLAVNRLTGIFFWQLHRKLWSGWYLKGIVLLTFAYPLILSGYPLGYCIFSNIKNACSDLNSSDLVTISNIGNAVLALCFGLITVFSRKLKINKLQKKQNYEVPLLIQSVITSSFLVISEILRMISHNYVVTMSTTGKFKTFDFTIFLTCNLLVIGSSSSFVVYYFSSTLFLFIMSSPVRQGFISFYHLDRIFRRNQNNRTTDISLFTIRRSNSSTVPLSP